MARVFVKPLEGKHPVYPCSSRQLPAEGAEVNLGVYWSHLVRDRAVEIIDPPQPKAKRAKRANAREGGHRAD